MTWTTPQTFAVDEEMASAKLNTNVRDNLTALAPDGVTSASWTPTLDGATSGTTDAAANGREYRIGPLQFAFAAWDEPNLLTGAGGAVSGALQVSLPTSTSVLTVVGSGGQAIGGWRFHDSSATANSLSGSVYLQAGATARFGLPSGNVLTNASFTIAAGDRLTMWVCYLVA